MLDRILRAAECWIWTNTGFQWIGLLAFLTVIGASIAVIFYTAGTFHLLQ